MFEKIIVEQNPHWEGKQLDCGVPRHMLTTLLSFLESKQVLIITGIRRSGKSYLLRQILAHLSTANDPHNILYLNLENPFFEEHRNKATSLEKIFEDYLVLTNSEGRKYVLLDEVQFFKHWQIFVKAKYERSNIKFILTGSNAWLLSSEFITLLSGRCLSFELYPFSFQEFCRTQIQIRDRQDLIRNELQFRKLFLEYREWGGFPEIIFSPSPEYKRELLTTYYKNIVFNDVIPRFRIANFKETEELAHYLLSNIGKQFSYNRLSTIVGLTDKTIKEYIHYFEQAYLLFEVSKYDRSVRKQIVNPKKIFSGDTGLSMIQGFRFSGDLGRLLENIVFLELKRRRKDIFYFSQQQECDFIVREKGRISMALQVCFELNHDNREREFSGLLEALQEFKLQEGYILTSNQGEEVKMKNKNIRIIPVWKWLLA